MLAIVTSNRAVSLQNVATHIAKVAKLMGIDVTVYERLVSIADLKRLGRFAIIVQQVDPVVTPNYMLLNRNCVKYGVPCVFYATTEGLLDVKHIHAWMAEGRYIAVSNYVREKLEESGIPVEDVIHHGVDMEEVEHARKNIHLGEKYILNAGIDHSKYIVVSTIARSLPRKGLWWLAKIAKEVAKMDSQIKFLVVTDDHGLEHFRGLDNVVAKQDFGKLYRALELAIIGASHIHAVPSLGEGFGLLLLESMVLGVPVIHADLPPTREFSTGWRVPVVDVVKFIQTLPYRSGVIYEHHLYRVEEFAKTIVEVAEMVRNNDETVKQYRQKAVERASEMDIRNMYPKLIKKVL
ncbi:MAG: glycosyltransferase [Pyrobaculum sp.]|jgi:glycosyltransferase involved in cell wall biosynthesis